jgi:hypothetical protein
MCRTLSPLTDIHIEVQRQLVIASVYFLIVPLSVAVYFLTLFHPAHRASHTVSVGPHGDVMLRADEDDTASGLLPADRAPLPGHIAMYQIWVQEMSLVTDFMTSSLQPDTHDYGMVYAICCLHGGHVGRVAM